MGNKISRVNKPLNNARLNPINSYEDLLNSNQLLENQLTDISDKANDLVEGLQCIICYNNVFEYVPTCGHIGICGECFNDSKFRFRKNCVICSKKVKYVKLFLKIENINDDLKSVIRKKLENKIENLEIINKCASDNNKVLYENNNKLIKECSLFKKQMKLLIEQNSVLQNNLNLKNLLFKKKSKIKIINYDIEILNIMKTKVNSIKISNYILSFL